jgi:uncharacterized protein YodC (DUF2158 family)
MEKYSINDFQIGDSVYHLSNAGLKMIVVEINNNPDEISCRWIDKAGIIHCIEFMPQELGKSSDLGFGL